LSSQQDSDTSSIELIWLHFSLLHWLHHLQRTLVAWIRFTTEYIFLFPQLLSLFIFWLF
jgi:hypothetical protein